MEQKKVRIVSNTGVVRFVTPHIANNARLLKSYGFMKQDFEKKEEEKKDVFVPPVVTEQIEEVHVASQWEYPEVKPELITLNTIEEPMTEEQAREKYFELFRKKPGNKKLETILSEIQDKLTT
jgi:hypothetical protein